MTTQLRNIASLAAVGFLASASGVAMANSIETQYSVYHLAAQMNATPNQAGQAGPAGPSVIPGMASTPSDWIFDETRYSIYHIAREAAAAPVGQAGRAGPDSTDRGAQKSGSIETQFSIYDLASRP